MISLFLLSTFIPSLPYSIKQTTYTELYLSLSLKLLKVKPVCITNEGNFK